MATADPVYNPPVTGGFPLSQSLSGFAVTGLIENSSDTANSHAELRLKAGGSSGGDPRIVFEVPGGTSSSFGVDNDNSDLITLITGTALNNTSPGLRFNSALGTFALGTSAPSVSSAFPLWIRQSLAGNFTFIISNDNTSNSARVFVSAPNTTDGISLRQYGTGEVTTLAGVAMAGNSGITSTKTTVVGTTAAGAPLVLMANNTETARIDDATGRLRFASASITANGSGAVTAPGAIGPAAISVQAWLTVQDSAGNTRYIPLYG